VDTGSTVVLTGVGAKGQVGEVVARAFADLGASLVLVDRTTTNVDERAAELKAAGHSARGYACDLTNADAVASLAADVRQNHGDRLGALVHMAGGFGMSGPVAESSLDVWSGRSRSISTAYRPRAFLQCCALEMAPSCSLPRTLDSSSTGANRSAYAVAKSGVVTLMRSIANEERKNGVAPTQ
jgi:NAD(P)-dependent dehydrogenase (short-subunit alcohol dehydrogenase family)